MRSLTEFDKDRWQFLSPYLDRALEMSREERADWLASLRAENPALASDLETLLAERSALSREGFLEATAPGLPAAAPLAGQAMGSYTLVSPIGQGGMGTVWLARRSDGRFEGVAAVKLLNASLVGRAGEDRFRREGNILARLTHPNIARLIDAGVSPNGQPYLVLEYVEGQQIDRYCDGRGLDIGSRIRLFLDVLAAVSHAHANLVVHRDIKPSNVLVSNDDQVKLLDFGIAKLLEADAMSGEATALTRDGGRAFTPEYAAPEQMAGGTITTATDVYALGALLYVLLGGRHPAGEAVRSPAELLRAIVDTEPQRLSDAFATTRTQSKQMLDAIAGRRASTPERLQHLLQGDLDTIVAKTLKKRPEERYASVTALGDDLRRFLSHEPIRARPDTLVYRSAKFVRRNRIPVALTAAALLALAAGLVGTMTQSRRATRQAALAESERDFALRQLSRAESINDLNSFLLSDAAPGGKPFTVGDLLARAEQIVERESSEADVNRTDLMIAIGRQYQMLDENIKARRLLTQAYEAAGRGSDRATHARAACALASAVSKGSEFGLAENLLKEGLDQLADEPQFALDRVFCLLRGSEAARYAEKPDAGIERVLAAQRVLHESREGSALLDLRVAMDLAEAYRTGARYLEADAAFEQASARLTAVGRDDTETAGTLFNNWALVKRATGQVLEAERLFRRAVQIGSAGRSEQSVSPMLLNNLARTLADLNRLSEARTYAERANEEARRAGNEIVITHSLFLRPSIYRQLGELDHAASVLAELELRVKQKYAPGHFYYSVLASEQGLLAQARGDARAAREAQDRALAIVEAGDSGKDFIVTILLRRSALELESGQMGDALSDASRALDLEKRNVAPGTFSMWLGRAHLALGRALLAQNKLADARSSFSAALANLEPSLGADHPETQDARRLSLDLSAKPATH